MHTHTESLKVLVATCVVALAAGCSSSGSSASGGGGSPDGASGQGQTSSSAQTSGSGGGSAGTGAGGATGSQETWADGKILAGSVVIPAGTTVTIAPGATITAPAGATITVQGTLTASSATPAHAVVTGSGWTGIVVAGGGTLALDGVDITGASTALDLKSGATNAEYDNGIISGAATSFFVEEGSALTTKHAAVTAALGSSAVSGSLTASFLDYDSSGNTGIVMNSPTATLSFEDSTLHGSGPVADMLVASSAASLHVAYTTITNVHCAFHFTGITAFDISFTNLTGNAYGFMLYGSDSTGTRTVTSSNIDNNPIAFDTQSTNGPILFSGDYVTGTQTLGTAVTVSSPAALAVPGTGPRG